MCAHSQEPAFFMPVEAPEVTPVIVALVSGELESAHSIFSKDVIITSIVSDSGANFRAASRAIGGADDGGVGDASTA